MSKIIHIVVLCLFCNFNFAQEIKNDVYNQLSSGQLTAEEFDNFKKFIFLKVDSIKSPKTYIINYLQPVGDCFYDQYQSYNCDNHVTWFEKNVYNKVNLDNETLKLYFRNKIIKPSKRVCRVIHDSNDYLYKTFFKKNELCYGLIVINENGEFITFTGEYTHKTINIFIEDLKIQKQ